jgi:hypothetical protein
MLVFPCLYWLCCSDVRTQHAMHLTLVYYFPAYTYLTLANTLLQIPSWFEAEGLTKYNPFTLPEVYWVSQRKKVYKQSKFVLHIYLLQFS